MSRLVHQLPLRTCLLAVALLAAVAQITLCSGAAATQAATLAWPAAAFPLKVRPGQRYLEDAAGNPFLIHGDAAWSLIAQLTREDAERYLKDRRARGFNTLLVNLLEHKFSTKAPANIYGQPPFLKAGDFSTPNEEYFAHADWVLRLAADNGFLVLLAPAYVGFGGGNDGWYQAMLANAPDKLRTYGRYVGHRYRDFANIIWVHAGDYNPPDKDRVRAIALGIVEFDQRALHTAHGAPETAAADYWGGEPWLHINNVYTYKTTYPPARAQYARSDRMPFFLMESAYENEHGATELRVRIQAYQALLSGAAGQVYGNNPIWRFDGPALHPAPTSWQQALDSRGAQSMTHLRSLFASLPWWSLEPDIAGALVTGGEGSGQDKVVAARVPDKSLALIYLPSLRKVRVDLGQLAGPKLKARWYDPAAGRFVEIAGSPFPAEGSHVFHPGTANGAGLGDWVLVLERES